MTIFPNITGTGRSVWVKKYTSFCQYSLFSHSLKKSNRAWLCGLPNASRCSGLPLTLKQTRFNTAWRQFKMCEHILVLSLYQLFQFVSKKTMQIKMSTQVRMPEGWVSVCSRNLNSTFNWLGLTTLNNR